MAERKARGSSVTRVMDIVEAVSNAERPMSPADISFQLDIPKASLHRLLQQLEDEGFVQTNMRGQIVPGKRMYNIALGVMYSSRYKAERQAILQHLGREIDEACGIAIPDGTEMVYYDRVQSSWPLQFNLQVGSRVPLWCTSSGKLYLASLNTPMRHRIINNLPLEKYARSTLTDPEALERSLLEIQQNEMGIDNEEYIDGMVGCSVPIRNADGRLLACLYTHAPVIRKSLDDLRAFEPKLRKAAEDLGQLIADDGSE